MTEWRATKRSVAPPVSDAPPASGASPTSEASTTNAPTSDALPVADAQLASDALSADNTPAGGDAQSGGDAPQASNTPAGGDAPQVGNAPQAGNAPTVGDALQAGNAPAGDNAPRSQTLLAADYAEGDGEPLSAALRGALAREYELGERIGQGGFGAVYRGVHRRTQQAVAIKILRPLGQRSYRQVQARVARFEREAELCANLSHPNIVRLLDKGKIAGEQCYAVFELVPGETLRERLLRKRALPVLESADIMGQVLDAVACAQARGIVHRDLKPENIMVIDTGRRLHVKVLDFGIGTLTLEARDLGFESLTSSREMLGTPLYSAPEQLRGDAPTTRSDLYSWALVFLECLMGRAPIEGATLAQIYHQHLSPLEIALPAALARHSLGEFLRRLLRKNPMARPADANQLYKEFRALHLANLVGSLHSVEGSASQAVAPSNTALPTIGMRRAELRQLTALAVGVRLCPSDGANVEPELLETLLRDQVNSCRDICARFGGRVVGGLGEYLLVYFGFPVASDTDARRGARTAFELADELSQRQERLRLSHPIELEFRVGLHTGTVLIVDDTDPGGVTASVAMSLCAAAQNRTILVSETTQRLLETSLQFDAPLELAVNGRAGALRAAALLGERRIQALASNDDGRTQLVGRDAELRQLDEMWAAGKRGDRRAVMLVGEPGVGKSRLLREWLQRSDAAPAVLETRCLAEHGNDALFPILQLLQHEWRLDLAHPTAAAQRVERSLRHYQLPRETLLPIYCTWLGLQTPEGYQTPAMAPHRQREVLMESVVQLLPRLREQGSSLLVVEDLHWADPSTVQLLGQLVSRVDPGQLFVIGSSRPRFELTLLTEQVARFEVKPLAPQLALELVRQRFVGQPVEERALQAIAERTDGVPLFIEELSHMLLDRQAAWDRDRLTWSGADEVPVTLRDLLAERLDRQGGAREVAQTAAALGREFDAAVLVLSCRTTEMGTRAALQQLVEAELLIRVREGGGERYAFRHALIRDAAYDSMPSDLRRQTHERIARVLEQDLAASALARPEAIARHHAGALEFEQAAKHGLRAVRRLLERSANQEAMVQALEVESWLQNLPEAERVDAELRNNGLLTQALMATEGWASPRVRERAERSRQRLDGNVAREHVVATLFGLFMHHHVASNRPACREVAAELQQYAESVNDASLLSVATTAQGVRCHAEGDFTQAQTWLERARSLYLAERDERQGIDFGLDCRVWATAQLALVEFGRGRSQRAHELAKEAIAWARHLSHVPSLGIALLYTSQIHQMAGDKPAVLRVTGELLENAQSYGLPAFEGYAAAIRAWAEAQYEAVAGVIAVLEQLNCNLILSYYGSYLADIEEDRQRFYEAATQLDVCLKRCERLGEHCFEAELLRRRAVCEARLAEPDVVRVRQLLEQAASLACTQGMYRFEALALRDLQNAFSLRPEQDARLREILQLRPELVALPAPLALRA